MSIGAAHTTTRPMSGAEFRSFQETRPDNERWELIKGIPVMMVPPLIAHQRIADNLVRLLNNALAVHDPRRFAVSRSGVELGNVVLEEFGDDYRPEPDVMVLDADFEPRQRFVECAYLIAEIVSDTDHRSVTGEDEPWIAIKRRLYLAHPPCEAVLLVDPMRVEIGIDLRIGAGWAHTDLARLDESLNIPSCGLKCMVADVYEGTPLNPRRFSKS
jgi:Uma2 family endonuclease